MNETGTPTTNVYVLFCATGKEAAVAAALTQMGLETMLPKRVERRTVKGMVREVVTNLIPGYLFVKAEAEPEWHPILRLPGVIRPLWYGDGQHELRGSDLRFIAYLERIGNVLEASQVVRIGSRIRFVSGPLREMGGDVVKVNKHRKVVLIRIGDEGLIQTLWCPIEYLEACTDMNGIVLEDSPPPPRKNSRRGKGGEQGIHGTRHGIADTDRTS